MRFLRFLSCSVATIAGVLSLRAASETFELVLPASASLPSAHRQTVEVRSDAMGTFKTIPNSNIPHGGVTARLVVDTERLEVRFDEIRLQLPAFTVEHTESLNVSFGVTKSYKVRYEFDSVQAVVRQTGGFYPLVAGSNSNYSIRNIAGGTYPDPQIENYSRPPQFSIQGEAVGRCTVSTAAESKTKSFRIPLILAYGSHHLPDTLSASGYPQYVTTPGRSFRIYLEASTTKFFEDTVDQLPITTGFRYFSCRDLMPQNVAYVAAARGAVFGTVESKSAASGTAVALSASVLNALGGGHGAAWFRNGTQVQTQPGAAVQTLTLDPVQVADAGLYVCRLGVGGVYAYSNAATLAVEAPANHLSNLSVRTALAARQTLIVGAVSVGEPKSILVRAAGPALGVFGLPGMSDPRLDLYTSGSLPLAVNDDWPAALAPTFTSVGAFPFAVGSKDAAILQQVRAAFSVQCQGESAGTVLVEAYDVSGASTSRLVNLSARNRVGAAEADLLIAGFTISGPGRKQVLLRGVGPGLQQFGVSSALADPVLKVYDAKSVLVAENNNWDSSLAARFSAVGAFALQLGSRDAAVVVTLDSGTSYTIQVSGANGGTGEALIEVYELP